MDDLNDKLNEILNEVRTICELLKENDLNDFFYLPIKRDYSQIVSYYFY